MKELRDFARRVSPAIRRLDSLLVPLCGSFQDSNGKHMMPGGQAREELVQRLRDAKAAIESGLEVLEQ